MRSTALITTTLLAMTLGGTATAHAVQPTTERLSVSSSGAQADGRSTDASISDNGRYVVFASDATNLVAGDTNAQPDVFLRDRLTGTTTRLSVTSGGDQSPAGAVMPRLSARGSAVAFVSRSALTPDAPAAGAKLYVAQRDGSGLQLIPAPAGIRSFADLAISDDGSRVVFTGVSPERNDVYLADVASGRTQRMSELPNATAANASSWDAAISGDGNWVAFTTVSTNLVTPDANAAWDVVLRNVDDGSFTLVSQSSNGVPANGQSASPALDYDGCHIAFQSAASNLVANDKPALKAFVRDRCAGTTTLASQGNDGAQGPAAGPYAISDDGCSVVLTASGNVLNPAPKLSGVALRDVCAATTSRMDVNDAGEPGNTTADSVAISGTGR